MALATKCPHCGTTFRVASDQLKLRGGIVRCGTCQQIFDANASLVDLDVLAPAQAAPAPSEAPAPAPAPAPAADDEQDIPVYTVDFDSALDPLGILPEPEPAEPGEPAQPGLLIVDVASPGEPDVADQPQHTEPPAETNAPDEQPEPGEIATTETETIAEPEPPGENVEPEPLGEEVEPEPLGEETDLEPLGDNTEPEAHEDDEPGSPAEDAAQEHNALPEPAPVVDAAPASQPRADKPVFSMGSALLSEPGQAPQSRVEPALDVRPDEELVAAPPSADHGESADDLHAQAEAMARFAAEHTPLPLRESADGGVYTGAAPPPPKPARSRLAGRRSKLTPTRIAPPKLRVPEIDEPDFVKRGRQKEQTGKRQRILMAAGSAALALVLAGQALYSFRNDLAARFPAMKPALVAACALLRCRVELPARIENLTIEQGELQTVGANTYMLTTLLHNQAGIAQAWPAIELALTDANDKPLLRRVFTPGEYLPKGALPAAGFGAHAEQPVKLYFQLDQLKPSGYHIAIFYP
jgi:predicted Zn finger-like uncharacterized protein